MCQEGGNVHLNLFSVFIRTKRSWTCKILPQIHRQFNGKVVDFAQGLGCFVGSYEKMVQIDKRQIRFLAANEHVV